MPFNHHKKSKAKADLKLLKSFSHNLILKNEIFISLVFHKKMIVQYKLNCFFARKLHRNCMEGNKNTKAILSMKERRKVLFSKYSRMSRPSLQQREENSLIWFGNILNNKLFSPRPPKSRCPCISKAEVMDSMKIYVLFIRVHACSQKHEPL